MLEANRKIKKPTRANFVVFVLLLVASGFTLTGCQNLFPGGKTTEKATQKQPTKVEQQKSNKQLKKKQSSKANQKKNPDEDTQDDDDPE
jgi:hypothetical protein